MPIVDDVSLNKASIMERCLRRVFEEAQADPGFANQTNVDALILNLERACQAAIDLAMHLVSRDRLGVPQSSAEAFILLCDRDQLSADVARRLTAMVGFRNVAVHSYRQLDMEIVRVIVDREWTVFADFCEAVGMKIDPRR